MHGAPIGSIDVDAAARYAVTASVDKTVRVWAADGGRLLRILRFIAHDLNLRPSPTVYLRHGKGGRLPLRFSKSGDPKLEQAYSTHFVWPGNGPFHRPASPEVL